ncbi:SGNH/GDSL hydrolase family protein [Tepidiforma thermophila]|uniref:Lysophospholipase L1-like esterase n=1 Tax=Tepidiforma thermophila (strain KCTC 52669 / CGMCC 1.13589 / G233) TaxID=2761530 RepID=A0A2A9HJV7_TEPT2|nr:SGNH/GDSL hydrolase family protein [Tepidiforma thermophila]PFG75276.1 lysophospholipase L1-like esterase [Tepidiforma thermophila]
MPLRILALGDSYTIGEAVDPAERWPAQLARRLRSAGFDLADPVIIATTGWTTAELAAALDAASPAGPFDLVTLLIGVNDQYRGLPCDESYRARLDALILRAVASAAGDPSRVVVLSIPDWGVTPFANGRDRARIAAEIDAFNEVNRAAAAGAGARWLDVTPVSREAARDPGLLAGDGLHPSAAMYARWVELLLPHARAILAPSVSGS